MMSRIFHFILLLVLPNLSQGTTYYVSSTGSDSNTGLSSSAAWQTISMVNSQSFNPGDEILFRKGDVFRGILIVTDDGTIANPITFSSYGNGSRPIFALPLITSWTDMGAGVFRTSMSTSNFTGVWEDYIPVQPQANSITLSDGSWFEDGSFLYYRPSSGHPSNHEVGAVRVISSYESGIQISDRRFIQIENLSFRGMPAGVSSLDVAGGTEGITIKSCDFQYCQSAIIFLPNLNNNRSAIIDSNYFYRNHNSVRMYTASAIAGPVVKGENINCLITNNEMFQDGTIDGETPWNYGFTDFESIGLQNFSDGLIADNYIHHCFAQGIIFYNLSGKSSDDNFILRNRFFDNSKTPFHFTGEDANTNANFAYNGNVIGFNIFSKNTSVANDPAIWFDQGFLANRTNYFVNNVCFGQYQQVQITRSDVPIYFTIRNNIFYGVDYNIWIYGSSAPSQLNLDYNLYYSVPQAWGWFMNNSTRDLSYIQGLGYEINGLVEDPQFIDPGIQNFRILDGSPATNFGTSTPGLTHDFENITLSANPNAGLFETEACTSSGNLPIEIAIDLLEATHSDNGTVTNLSDDSYDVTLNISDLNGSIGTSYSVLLDGKNLNSFNSGVTHSFGFPTMGANHYISFMEVASGSCLNINEFNFVIPAQQ